MQVSKILVLIVLLLAGKALFAMPHARTYAEATGILAYFQIISPLPAQQMSGVGAPTATCGLNINNGLYIDTTVGTTSGRFWLCLFNTSTSAFAWAQQLAAVQGVGTTASFASQAYILGGCTSVLTATISGATVGVNTATASPIYATAPTATNPGLLNVTAWVSAANTVSVQGCAFGTLGTMPAFTAKVLVY